MKLPKPAPIVMTCNTNDTTMEIKNGVPTLIAYIAVSGNRSGAYSCHFSVRKLAFFEPMGYKVNVKWQWEP